MVPSVALPSEPGPVQNEDEDAGSVFNETDYDKVFGSGIFNSESATPDAALGGMAPSPDIVATNGGVDSGESIRHMHSMDQAAAVARAVGGGETDFHGLSKVVVAACDDEDIEGLKEVLGIAGVELTQKTILQYERQLRQLTLTFSESRPTDFMENRSLQMPKRDLARMARLEEAVNNDKIDQKKYLASEFKTDMKERGKKRVRQLGCSRPSSDADGLVP